ncbi:MAG: hypothetical protein GY778_31835 [bacterium]|nr:hypothetical protein [bacterium]
MNAVELVADLQRRDVVLSTNGDRLRVDAPAGALTPALRATLRACKGDLLSLLQWRDSTTRTRQSGVPAAVITPDDLPAEWRVEWEERAAIREFDAGQAREHAEAEALQEVIARMRTLGCWEG